MFGLAILAALVVYLAISIGVVVFVVRWAKKRGRRPVIWGILAGIFMYHLVFWDFLPTFVVFKYYCHTRSGFWVYKTPEQWKTENPRVAETLTWRELSPDYISPGITRGIKLNERISSIFTEHRIPLLNLVTTEESIVDLKNNETLVKHVRVYSGRGLPDDIRFWTHMRQKISKKKDFDTLRNSYKKLGKETQ